MPESRHPPKRRLYLVGDAINDFQSENSATNLLSSKGVIAAAMSRWVLGGLVYGDSKRGLFLDRLDPPPDEVWEVRVTEPNVQVRLFGRFCEQDTLVLTNFHTRNFLGRYGSAAWKTAMNSSVTQWAKTGLPLLKGTKVGDYVSENFDDFPI